MYFTFTLESMRLNPTVQFVLIHLVNEAQKQDSKTLSYYKKMVPNFHVHTILVNDFSKLIYKKLGFHMSPQNITARLKDINKICDYKPVLAYLFPEYLDNPEKM